MNIKKLTALLCAVVMVLSLAACGGSGDKAENKHYTVGICQLVQHDALDAATKGFRDAITDALGAENVTFDEQNAAGDSATCATICNGFVSSGVDLILANATGALEAAAAATKDIPILGTAVTEYGVALGIDNFSGTVGGNISGTSDLAPLDQQAAMLTELFPDAKNVGIIYCSGEANSVYQADVVKAALEKAGCTVNVYKFADTNDVVSVTAAACDANDVLYVPTDNTAASCTEAIANVVIPAKVPVIAGEQGICSGCGVATLSIDYNELGQATGEMAYEILVKGANPGDMEVQAAPTFTKMYNKANCEKLGITIPDDYTAIEG